MPCTLASRPAPARAALHEAARASSHGITLSAVTAAWATPVASIDSRTRDRTASFHTSSFHTSSMIPDPNATETSASGYYGWANIPPGAHTMTVSHPTLTCTSVLDPDGTAGIPLTIEADTVTSAFNYSCQ